jgi:hypothetical protein
MKKIVFTSFSFFILLFIWGCNSSRLLPLSLIEHPKCLPLIITVRTHEHHEYQFIKDSVLFEINFLNQNNHALAKGRIGLSSFDNCPVRYNQGLLPPSITGIEWIVTCDNMGPLFEKDPLARKQMEIWITPEDEKGNRSFEIRYTDGMSKFPMAGGTWTH